MIQTWFCDCPQYLCLFHIVFEYSPSIHDQGKMLVLPNQLLLLSSFHIGGSQEIVSMTFAAVICDADDPCSVNTA